VEIEWWVCTHDGLFILDKYSLLLKNHYLKENNVSNVMINQDNAIWISTTDNGVYFGPNRYILQQNLKEILGDISIIKIASNNILIGSTKGELLVKENIKKTAHYFNLK
jgi:ligand-binding sensor domain-containing protein